MLDGLLHRLALRKPIEETVALVVAHPDDEVIGAGAVLPLFRRLILVHVTDGAPRNLADATAHGFPDAACYAAARSAELDDAFTDIKVERVGLGAADQGASAELVPLTHALRTVLARHRVDAVLTHAYEGGHPDHDATAFLAAHCKVPVYEFASYHAGPDGSLTTGTFLPGPDSVRLCLTPEERRRKRAMLDCFVTQAATLAAFGTGSETFRTAPLYDFAKPPHPGVLHYEHYDWGMTGERWRSLARTAHAALC